MAKKAFSIILILAGIYFIFMPISIKDSGTEATGTVLSVNTINTFSVTEQKNLRKTDVIVSYQNQNGQIVQFDTTSVPPFTSYKTGQKVTVLYDPQNPSLVSIKDSNTKWYIPGFLILFGLLAFFSTQLLQLTSFFNHNKIGSV